MILKTRPARHGAGGTLALLALLSGCATVPVTPGTAPERPRATVINPAGLERVMGRDADAVIALLGTPDQDQREDRGRRLQFVGPACVLDAYFYAKGNGKAVVTWVDARTPAGGDFDRASCLAALSRR
ncbi:hypothetical protein [Sphingomonas montana]|uniref:hypothetical protein n=1 Tax=Sphingomonas montana TaxID=1843236 RepID=UPI00096FD034|nr:hypothetical protein [Sphingomonas montana]